jgi:hypothetical protein
MSQSQLETGSTATAYQRVVSQYDVTEAGVSSLSYLQFDTSKFLVTPTLSLDTTTSDGQARRNLLTFPAAFDNAAWAKFASTVTANVGVAPDGTTSADKVVPNTTSAAHYIEGAVSKASSAITYTASVYVKADGYNFGALGVGGNIISNQVSWAFDLTNGTISSPTVSGTGFVAGPSFITPLANGWFRIVVSVTTDASATVRPYVRVDSALGTPTYTGDGTSGILIWGAQLELGSTATAFQNIGSNKAQVFAGVRKLSDEFTGTVLDINGVTGTGSIMLRAPAGSTIANYGFYSSGSIAFAGAIPPPSFPAPITNILTGIGNIEADTNVLRVNGLQVASSTADQGTGNYSALPLYVGMRQGSALPLNGQVFGLIVRFGANLTADQITSTETWVAGKTGFFTPVISGQPTVGVS